MTERLVCPECGDGTIELVTDGLVSEVYATPFLRRGDPLPVRLVPRAFGACNRCEFCIEVRS